VPSVDAATSRERELANVMSGKKDECRWRPVKSIVYLACNDGSGDWKGSELGTGC